MNRKLKVGLLCFAMALSFGTGYSGTAHAWPVDGRNEFYGYFKDRYDAWGDNVWHINGAGQYAIPTSINNADAFINFVLAKLSRGTNTQDGVGASFIIQTMIGSSYNLPPTGAEIADWESRVRYADSQGWVSWDTIVSYQLNSMYQGPCGGYDCNNSGVNPTDDTFYNKGITRSGIGIIFRNGSGGVAYELEYSCANPVGVVSPLQRQPQYSIGGSSFVSSTGVVPGQTVTFWHNLTNFGPDIAPSVGYGVYNQYGGWVAGGGPFPLWPGTLTVNANNITVPNNSLPGTQFCQYINYSPLNQDGWSGNSGQVCATVINDFHLSPIVTASSTAAQANDTVTFNYSVFNSGPTPSTAVTCKAVGGTHTPGYTPLPAQDVDRNPDLLLPLGCPRNFYIGSTYLYTESVNVGNLKPGSRICRSLVVDPRDQFGGARSSAEACAVIAKTPYAYFLGNDVWAGGGFADINPACNASSKITTSAHLLQNGTVAGSLTEYAAFALGKITNFGSAGKAIVDPAAATGKMLTFSNTVPTNLGYYGAPQHCINSYISTYNTTPITAQPGTIDVNQGSGTHQINGAHTFHGNVPNGSQQIWLVNGDVTIDGDIKYSNSYNALSDIPSLIIISTGNILVKGGVVQMDGLYVAKNTFNTCSDAPSGNLSVNDCNKQLNVNGGVIVGSLSLLRTYGADGNTDTTRKVPGEQFNFNAEMYLNSALKNTGSTTLRTVDQKDLPPRY